MGRLVKIQSLSDLITNSSSEVYLCKVTENFKNTFKGLEKAFSAIFFTEEDIKKYLLEKERWELEDLDEVLKYNPLSNYELWDWCEEAAERTKEEIIDFFFPAYKCLLGYALFSREDTYEWDVFDDYLKNRNKDEDKVAHARY